MGLALGIVARGIHALGVSRMTNEAPDLLPCPFCGHQPRVYGAQIMVNGDCPEAIDCDNDDCPVHPTTGYMQFDQAIAAWNTRADIHAAVQAENARLREALQRADDELTNLQPHIPCCCYPGKAGFIDVHIDAAQEAIRAALGAEKQTEGETAFPVSSVSFEPCTGMTKHDWYAGQAVAGMLAHPTRYRPRPDAPQNWHDAISQEAHQIADAMIAALGAEKPTEGETT